MQGGEDNRRLLRRLPQVQRLLEAPEAEALVAAYAREAVRRGAAGGARPGPDRAARRRASAVPAAAALLAEARRALGANGGSRRCGG